MNLRHWGAVWLAHHRARRAADFARTAARTLPSDESTLPLLDVVGRLDRATAQLNRHGGGIGFPAAAWSLAGMTAFPLAVDPVVALAGGTTPRWVPVALAATAVGSGLLVAVVARDIPPSDLLTLAEKSSSRAAGLPPCATCASAVDDLHITASTLRALSLTGPGTADHPRT